MSPKVGVAFAQIDDGVRFSLCGAGNRQDRQNTSGSFSHYFRPCYYRVSNNRLIDGINDPLDSLLIL